MLRKIIAAVFIVIAISGGAWYYFSRVQHARIEKILGNPKAYEGKEVTIEGEVTDRTALFVIFKFFKVRDETGEIIVVTKKTLPEARSTVVVKGRINEAFPVGDQKLTVFLEGSIEGKGSKY
jgi:hypothetical protein